MQRKEFMMKKYLKRISSIIMCTFLGTFCLNILHVETYESNNYNNNEEIKVIENDNISINEEITDKVSDNIVIDNNTNINLKKDTLPASNTGLNSTGTGVFITPLEGTLTSEFGPRWGSTHGGIDIAAPTGTEILAADNARVVFAKNCGTYGLLVKLDHNNGYVTYYAHCSRINVKVDDIVNKGDVIAFVGSTGNSTGPHCHFEIRYNNEKLNPLNFIECK